jgi:hypothetical protein
VDWPKKSASVNERALNQQSFGNCESWEFIVGKKRKNHRRKIPAKPSAWTDKTYKQLIHTLSTGFQVHLLLGGAVSGEIPTIWKLQTTFMPTQAFSRRHSSQRQVLESPRRPGR